MKYILLIELYTDNVEKWIEYKHIRLKRNFMNLRAVDGVFHRDEWKKKYINEWNDGQNRNLLANVEIAHANHVNI